MKKLKIVTVGNLARNAKYFSEVLQSRYQIINIVTNNEEPIGLTKDIIISRKDNIIKLTYNIFKAYYFLLKSDLIFSFTASLSSSLFNLIFVKIKIKKYIAYATGSDLREGIYYKNNGLAIKNFFKKANVVVFHNNDLNTLNSIKYLNLKNIYWHNMYKQTEFNYSYIDQNYKNNSYFLTKIQDFINDSFSIFMPSFIDFRNEQRIKRYYCSKGNDLAYEALIKFVGKYPNTKIVLRGVGIDTDYAKKILEPINQNIMYIETLNKKDYINLMSMFDVIIDSFKQGAFGGVALEAASIGMPLLTNPPNIDFYKEDKYPFLQNKTSIDIYNNLVSLYEDINYRKNYANLCKHWVIRNHSRREYLKIGKIIDRLIIDNQFSRDKPNNGGFFDIDETKNNVSKKN